MSIFDLMQRFEGNLLQKQKNTAILHSKHFSKLKLFCHFLCGLRL